MYKVIKKFSYSKYFNPSNNENSTTFTTMSLHYQCLPKYAGALSLWTWLST